MGNCNPRLMRSTLYSVPATSDMMKTAHISFSLSISPFAELHEKDVSSLIKYIYIDSL